MQRQKAAFHSFSETIDFDQGSVSNSTVMSQQTPFSNMLNPVDSRLSNNAVSSGNASCSNALTHDVQSFSGWNSGESSSRLSLQNQVNDDGIKMEEWLSTSVNAYPAVGQRSEERLFETTNILFPGRVSTGISGNQVRSGPLFLQGSSSNHIAPNVCPNSGHIGDTTIGRPITGAVLGLNQLNPGGGLEIERASSSGVSSSDVGTSSGSSGYIVEETNGGSGSSIGVWGLSCKRKALEGTTGQSFPGGSSSCFPQAESSAWHNGPNNHSVSSSLSLSTPSPNTPSVAPPEQLNPRFGYGMRGAPPDAFPSSNVSGNADSLRNFGRRISPGHQQESVTFNLSTTGGSRRWSLQHSRRPVSVSDYLESRSTEPANSSAIQGQLHTINPSSLSSSLPCWDDFSSSRVGNSLSSLIPGELGAASREEANLRSFQTNNADHPMFAPATEMRRMGQDPTRWGLATGNMSTSGSVSSTRIGSSTRMGPSSSVHPFPTPGWIHHNPTTHNQQRISEFSTWSLFPPMASESGGHSCHFSPLSSGPSSAQDTQISSGSSSQGHNPPPFPRSAFLTEEQSDDVLGMPRSLRALAADIEGRHRLISEVCNHSSPSLRTRVCVC
jgi:E3 ubiquitin-protein ligase Arkadia